MRDEGGGPKGITYPATAKVAQDVTTVRHGGQVDGEDSAFVVFFANVTGAYTVLEM